MKRTIQTIACNGKRAYVKPAMEVYPLQSRQALLAGSGEELPVGDEWPTDIIPNPLPW